MSNKRKTEAQLRRKIEDLKLQVAALEIENKEQQLWIVGLQKVLVDYSNFVTRGGQRG